MHALTDEAVDSITGNRIAVTVTEIAKRGFCYPSFGLVLFLGLSSDFVTATINLLRVSAFDTYSAASIIFTSR